MCQSPKFTVRAFKKKRRKPRHCTPHVASFRNGWREMCTNQYILEVHRKEALFLLKSDAGVRGGMGREGKKEGMEAGRQADGLGRWHIC